MVFRKWVGAVFGVAWLAFAPAVHAGVPDNSDTSPSLKILNALKFDANLVERIHRARVLPIETRATQGYSAKCGFYALSHAMHAFDSHAPNGETLYQTGLDNGWLWDENGSTLPKNLYLTMQQHGYVGGYGWGARGGSIPFLKKKLKEGYSILLAVRGTNIAGLPQHPGALSVGGHWVVLEGFVTIDKVEYLIVKDSANHSKEPAFISEWLEGSSLWPRKDFEDAWSFWTYITVRPAD